MHVRDLRVEVVRDLKLCAGVFEDLSHQIDRNAVRVVEGDQLSQRDRFVLLDIGLAYPLHGSGSALDGRIILLDLAGDDMSDDFLILFKVGKTDRLHLTDDKIAEVVVHLEVLHHSDTASQNETGEVSFTDIGRNDEITEHIGKASGVVAESIHGLHRDDDLFEFRNRDVGRVGHLLSEVADLFAADIHEAGKLGVQS